MIDDHVIDLAESVLMTVFVLTIVAVGLVTEFAVVIGNFSSLA